MLLIYKWLVIQDLNLHSLLKIINLFIWLLSNEDTEILDIVSSCIIELINYRAKMLNED